MPVSKASVSVSKVIIRHRKLVKAGFGRYIGILKEATTILKTVLGQGNSVTYMTLRDDDSRSNE